MPRLAKQTVFECQRESLQQLEEDASEIATTLAEQLWDKFETEITEAIPDGCMLYSTYTTQRILAATFAVNYQQAIERDVLSIFKILSRQLADAVGLAAIDTAHVDLNGLRKSLTLRQHAATLIQAAINGVAMPSTERAPNTIHDDISQAPAQQIAALDRDINKETHALRLALINQCSLLKYLMAQETSHLIDVGRIWYAQDLERLEQGCSHIDYRSSLEIVTTIRMISTTPQQSLSALHYSV